MRSEVLFSGKERRRGERHDTHNDEIFILARGQGCARRENGVDLVDGMDSHLVLVSSSR